MTMTDGIQRWRWLVKSFMAMAALGIPFVSVHGESLLRFDVPSLTLFAFGAAIGMDEFFIVLIAILFFSFFIITVTILFGRIWCGWLCPQTVVIELTGFVDRLASAGLVYRLVVVSGMLFISTLLAADVIWYFVPPGEFLSHMFNGTLSPLVALIWASLSIVTFLNFLLLRRRFCATVCPYAKIQGAVYDNHTLVIAPDTTRMVECMHCDACLRVCPVGIDVRKGPDMTCVNCAECIDACAARMKVRGRVSLIGYRFGLMGGGSAPFRRNVLLAGGVTAFFLVFLVLLLTNRTMIDFELTADSQSPPHITVDGTLINTFVLSATNRTDHPETFAIAVKSGVPQLLLTPDQLTIGPREFRRIHIAVRYERAHLPDDKPEQIDVVVSPEGEPGKPFRQSVTLFPAW